MVVVFIRYLSKLIRKLRYRPLALILLGLFALCLLAGILFQFIEGGSLLDAFYWALVTSSTVGYGDITPKTRVGKVIASIVIFVGITIFSFYVGVTTSFVAEKAEAQIRGRIKVGWKNHIVVLGWNEAAKSAIDELRVNIPDARIVVVANIDEIPEEIRDDPNAAFVSGDPTSISTLRKANVPYASYIIVAIGDDAKNIMATLNVRQMNKNATIIAEALRDESIRLLRQAGANCVISSRSFSGRLMASAVFESGVEFFFEDAMEAKTGIDIAEVEILDYAGKTFGELLSILKEKYNIIPLGIHRMGKVILNPNNNIRVEKGDRLIVLVNAGQCPKHL